MTIYIYCPHCGNDLGFNATNGNLATVDLNYKNCACAFTPDEYLELIIEARELLSFESADRVELEYEMVLPV